MTSFIDKLRSRMTGSLVKPMQPLKPAEKSRSTIVTTRWDEMAWQEARRQRPVDDLVTDLSLGDEHKDGERKPFDPAPELVHDLWGVFYKTAPRLVDKRDIAKDVRPVRKILDEIVNHPRFEELQALTAMDPVMSTIALQSTADTVREILVRLPPPPPPPGPGGKGKGGGKGDSPAVGQAPGEEEGEEEDEEEGGGSGGAGDGGQSQGENDDDLVDEDGDDELDMDAAHEEANQENAERDWEDDFDQALDDAGLENLLNRVVEEAANEAEELDGLRKSIGLEDGEWRSMDPEERLALVNKLRSPEMKALSEIIGRMKRFALGVKATREANVPHEAFDVEMGNDLRHVLRSEYALLATKETKHEFYRRYADKELLQFKLRGTEEVGKGPIIICIDKSGSMSGAPFNWAMAVSEALRQFAAEDDRDFYAMFFGNDNDRERFDFPKGKAPFEKVLAFLSCRANGGTQFAGVLSEALARATTAFDGEARGKADIIFVTDGMAHLDATWIEQFNAERERTGVRMYSIYIGGARDMRYSGGPVGLLESISNVVIPVLDLTGDSVREVFQNV